MTIEYIQGRSGEDLRGLTEIRKNGFSGKYFLQTIRRWRPSEQDSLVLGNRVWNVVRGKESESAREKKKHGYSGGKLTEVEMNRWIMEFLSFLKVLISFFFFSKDEGRNWA